MEDESRDEIETVSTFEEPLAEGLKVSQMWWVEGTWVEEDTVRLAFLEWSRPGGLIKSFSS